MAQSLQSALEHAPRRRLGMPGYRRWLDNNDRFSEIGMTLEAQPSIATGRFRSLTEVRDHIRDPRRSPVRAVAACCGSAGSVAHWGLIVLTVLRIAVNVIAVTGNFQSRPCEFGDTWHCKPGQARGSWEQLQYLVAVSEAVGMSLIALLLTASLFVLVLDCCHHGGGGRPKSLYWGLMTTRSLASFSFFIVLRWMQPRLLASAYRDIWARGREVGRCGKVLCVAGTVCVLLVLPCVLGAAVFVKLSELQPLLLESVAQWHVVPHWLTFIGIVNQLVGVADPQPIEQNSALVLAFGAADAKDEPKQKSRRQFIAQVVALEAVGAWGWAGVLFLFTLGARGWRRLLITNEPPLGLELEVGAGAARTLGRASSARVERAPLLSEIRKRRTNAKAIMSYGAMMTSSRSQRLGSRGGLSPDSSGSQRGSPVPDAPVAETDNEGKTRDAEPVARILLINDCSNPLRVALQPCLDESKDGKNQAVFLIDRKERRSYWRGVKGGHPYRVIVDLTVSTLGRKAYVMRVFKSPLFGDFELRLDEILAAEPMMFGDPPLSTVGEGGTALAWPKFVCGESID